MWYNGNEVFQVEHFNREQYVVNMRNKECACRRWQLTCLPCVHSMEIIIKSNMDPFMFVNDLYKKENYMKAYSPVIYTLNGPSSWPKTND